MRRRHSAACTVALAAAAILPVGLVRGADASSSPPFKATPLLGRANRTTVVLGFQLTKPATRCVVRIAGRATRVHIVGYPRDAVYQATVRDAGELRSGRMHRVEIQACAGRACTSVSRLLYLHRRFADERRGSSGGNA